MTALDAFQTIGAICGAASLAWQVVKVAKQSRHDERRLAALALDRQVMAEYRAAAAGRPWSYRLVLLRAYADALSDQELLSLQSIGSLLFKRLPAARRTALMKGARRAAV